MGGIVIGIVGDTASGWGSTGGGGGDEGIAILHTLQHSSSLVSLPDSSVGRACCAIWKCIPAACIAQDGIACSQEDQTIIQQDNTSSTKLGMNKKQSSTKRNRHVNMRYFYVTSKVTSEEVKIV